MGGKEKRAYNDGWTQVLASSKKKIRGRTKNGMEEEQKKQRVKI